MRLGAAFLVGFGLGAWFGANRTIAQIRQYAGVEKWDRITQARRRPRAARGPDAPPAETGVP